MSDSERINKLIDWLKMKPATFSAKIGLTRPDAIYHIINKRNGISDNLAEKILIAFPNISKVWLLTGEGNMTKSDIETFNEPNSTYNKDQLSTNQNEIDMDAINFKTLIDYLKERDEQMFSELNHRSMQIDALISKIPNASGLGERKRPQQEAG